jgi:hypothetical protein
MEDSLLALNISYYDVIVVNHPINVSATVELETPNAYNLTIIWLDFPDAIRSPTIRDILGMPNPAFNALVLNQSSKYDHTLVGSASMYWDHDGSFSPLVRGIMKNGDLVNFGIQQSASIQVQPEEKLNELRTNYLNLVLTYAILILTGMGVTTTVTNIFTGQRDE